MRRSLLLSLVAVLSLSACGQAPLGASGALRARPAAALGVREASDGDVVMLHDIGEQAKQTQKDIDAKYAALGLTTAAGRKLTPAREAAIRDGLTPFLATLDGRFTGWIAQLQNDTAYADVAQNLSQRRPMLGDAVPTDASAADLLYRLTQYRLKLGTLIEYAVRHGAVADD